MANGWGGKRKGAGRKQNPKSARSLSKQLQVSTYIIRETTRIYRFAARVGFFEELFNLMRKGEVSVCQARRLCRIAAFDAEHGTKLLAATIEDAETVGWSKAIRRMWRKPRPGLF